ncbi:MAG: hypothetical protein COA78_15495 [Blastopirellula sp.]|nr:MAG: hypothetical protein COA78_15495 [Blastopirellula sp.]
MDFLELILRWAHLIPATIMVGGTLYMRMALLPAAATLEEEPRNQLKAELRSRWSKWVMMSAGLLIVSGMVNFILTVKAYGFPQGYYHPLFGLKFIFALAVFYIASLLTGRSAGAEKFREKESFWLSVNATLVILIVLMAGLMKVADREPKTDEQSKQSVVPHLITPSVAKNV